MVSTKLQTYSLVLSSLFILQPPNWAIRAYFRLEALGPHVTVWTFCAGRCALPEVLESRTTPPLSVGCKPIAYSAKSPVKKSRENYLYYIWHSYLVVDKTSVLSKYSISVIWSNACHSRLFLVYYLTGMLVDQIQRITGELRAAIRLALDQEGVLWTCEDQILVSIFLMAGINGAEPVIHGVRWI